MDISTGIANNTDINQLAGAGSVLTAAVANTNDVHASESKSLYPAYGFGMPESKGPMDISTGIANATDINQFAGPHSILTAAVVNSNDVDASEKSKSPYPAPEFFPLGWEK